MSTRRIPPRTSYNRLRTQKRDASGPLATILAALLLVVGVLGVIAFIGFFVVLSGLITLLAWNVGVVGIAAALGTKVATINLVVAICANLVIGVISRIFRGPTKVTTNS